MCGRVTSALQPIWRWRSWTRSAPVSRCSSSCRLRATGIRPACSWPRTPAPAAAGRSAATAWCGSWPHATCWMTLRLPSRSGRRCRVRWRRTGRWCSTRRWACIAARPRSSTGASRPIRTGHARTCASSATPMHCPPTCCITRRCAWRSRWPRSWATNAANSTRPGPTHWRCRSTHGSGAKTWAST
ncbi:hypothetical protein D3C73_999070 [compost metagenome]